MSGVLWVTSRLGTLAFVVVTCVRDLMVNHRRDQRAVSNSWVREKRTALTGSMRPDLVLGSSGQLSEASSMPGGTGARGQGFQGGTMAVLAASPIFIPAIAIDDLDAAGGSAGKASYLRCGGCGATIALEQRARHDGQLVDCAPDSHDPRGAPVAFDCRWGTDV